MSWWQKWKTAWASAEPVFPGLHSQETFRALIQRERARVDRNAHVFSLVLFRIDHRRRHPLRTERLVRELMRRRRFTDEVGVLDRDRIGVLLPETSPVGAQKFADDILATFADLTPPLGCTILSYPESPAPPGSTPDPRQLHFLNELRPSPPETPPAAPADRAAMAPPALGSFDDVELMLVEPLPGWKRFIDFAGALAGIVVLSPLLLLIGLVIKIVSPGPVFYRQPRVGHRGQLFTCWKFRTMRIDSDPRLHQRHIRELVEAGRPLEKLDGRDDPRIIPFGRFLRLSGLDELPQLLNVLRGEMSLIGPRPCIEYESEQFDRWQLRRFDTVPGLTGLWQVSGKNRTTFNQMMRLDIAYARKKSPWMDLLILLRTLPAICVHVLDHTTKRGASKQPASLA
jgi:lipopolysaccharide/colanic/teichoic acid biosynthesis glycosyltransferase